MIPDLLASDWLAPLPPCGYFTSLTGIGMRAGGAPKSIKWEKFKTDFLARYPQVNAASDIADAAKHCTLNKAARHPPKFDFVCLAAIERRWDDPGINWDEGHYWDGAPCLVAYDSNRNAIGVRHVLQRTINLWLTMESEGRL